MHSVYQFTVSVACSCTYSRVHVEKFNVTFPLSPVAMDNVGGIWGMAQSTNCSTLVRFLWGKCHEKKRPYLPLGITGKTDGERIQFRWMCVPEAWEASCEDHFVCPEYLLVRSLHWWGFSSLIRTNIPRLGNRLDFLQKGVLLLPQDGCNCHCRRSCYCRCCWCAGQFLVLSWYKCLSRCEPTAA